MNHNLLVSVIIPVYNCEKYLAQAIESVLAQSYQPLEIIVIDDCSTDNSQEVAKKFDNLVRYERLSHKSNNGAATGRNRGIELAKGTLLSFLDADDIWIKTKLELQVLALKNNPGIDMIFGKVMQFHSPELEENIKQNIYCSPEPIYGYHPGTILIKKEAFERVGKFNSIWEVGEFIDWYLQATEQGLKSLMLPEIVLKRRLHDSNMGIRNRNSRTDYVRILKSSLDRRRSVNQI